MAGSTDHGNMADIASTILANAQADEKKGLWMDAIGKRSEAIGHLVGRDAPIATPRPLDPNDMLEMLGEIYQPTKRNHDYLRRYSLHLRDRRFTARKVVEIGVQSEKSINMWEEYFPNATIYGLDIDPACSAFAGGRKQIFIGDQCDQTFLLDFIRETGGDFDVVIDDGLHTPYSMLRSFSFLYPALQSHGIYIIEDILRQPDTLRFLYGLMECINFYPADVNLREWPSLSSFSKETPWLISNTVGLSVYRYIAFIERGFNPRDNRYFLTREEQAARKAEKRAVVAAAAEELTRKGMPVTRDNLIAALGHPFGIHIDPYLQERKK